MTAALKLWADAVKTRDGKCCRCATTDDLHAHHIKPKSTHPELALDIANGETLCYRCHKAEHERNRPVRLRSNRPQRRMLERRIAELEATVLNLTKQRQKLLVHVKECERGVCAASVRRRRTLREFVE